MKQITSIVHNDDCLNGAMSLDNNSIDFAIIDAPYDYYANKEYETLLSILSVKLSQNSLLVIFTNNKYIIDAGYHARKYFDYWFMQHWIYDDGYLIHNTQPKDANRTIIYYRKGNPNCNINALRGKKINKLAVNKGSKFRKNDSGKSYVWKPNENGSHPLTYIKYKHTPETHGTKDKKPTGVKPLFICDMILSFANTNNVLDLFTGHGSFRIASYNKYINYIGFEISKDYYDSQEKRFMSYYNQPKLF